MPAPRIFISSTCYDLKYIRENLKYSIRNLGYEPILSEEGNIYFDPSLDTLDSTITEVPGCQIFVLIIGGRFGTLYRDTGKSITNAEYNEAVKNKIPVFALVERAVLDEYSVYRANLENPSLNANQISYPSVDSTKIFDFVDEVRGQTINNALVPFSNFEEIQSYLRQQWAGMMYRFLTSESEAKRVGDLFSALSSETEKIEFLTRKLVDSVADADTKILVELYDIILESKIIGDLNIWNIRVSPHEVLKHESLDDYCGGNINIIEEEDEFSFSIIGGGPPYMLSERAYEKNKEHYNSLRDELIEHLKEKGLSVDQFINKD